MSQLTWQSVVVGGFTILSTSVGISYAFWSETKDEMKDKVDNTTLVHMIERQNDLISEIKEMRENVNMLEVENALIKLRLEQEKGQ